MSCVDFTRQLFFSFTDIKSIMTNIWFIHLIHSSIFELIPSSIQSAHSFLDPFIPGFFRSFLDSFVHSFLDSFVDRLIQCSFNFNIKCKFTLTLTFLLEFLIKFYWIEVKEGKKNSILHIIFQLKFIENGINYLKVNEKRMFLMLSEFNGENFRKFELIFLIEYNRI